MIDFKSYVDSIHSYLNKMQVTDCNRQVIDQEEGLTKWCDLTANVKQLNSTMYFVGNGASAMMASHMAADATKNGGLRSLAFNDAALMTAISNDVAYEDCFSMPLERFAVSGSVFVSISSSGNSPNIVKAILTAKKMGLDVVTLSGMNPDNRSRQMGDLNFYIPADTYGLVEVTHQAILHCWLDKYIESRFKSE